MELNITKLWQVVVDNGAMDYSASVAEIGRDAGASTWANALDDSADVFFNPEDYEAIRKWVRGLGGWTDAEVAAMSQPRLVALLLQFIAGDARTAGVTTTAELTAFQPGDDGFIPIMFTDIYGDVYATLEY